MTPFALLLVPALFAQAPAPANVLRAQYAWGYAGPDGSGKGTVSVLIEPTSGKLILEVHGLGERLVLLEGNSATGYRVQIPRRELDATAPSLAALPLPFLPALGTVQALHNLLTQGTGPGIKVTKKDAKGPLKLRYSGQDDRGREADVWLERTKWEVE